MNVPIEILLVEDNPGDARLIERMLAPLGDGANISRVNRLAKALEHLDNGSTDLVLLDPGLPDSEGLEAVDRLLAHPSHPPLVLLTGQGSEAVAVEAMKRGVYDYLNKTASPRIGFKGPCT